MPKFSRRDVLFMRRCLRLAAKGEGRVSPNPLVGAVLVKNGKIIGEGYHEKSGRPHAEANALKGANAAGATLYVSLEPCSHCCAGKKTAPCAPLVIKSGVERVVIATQDPNPCVDGCGIGQLRAAGIRVQAGLLQEEAQEQNRAFFKFMRTGRPFFLLKLAQSSNGKIGIKGKSSIRLSGREFDACAQMLRNRCDAIAVGINTVLADDPRLTCRMKGGRNPVRIILDSRLRLPLSARVLRNAKKDGVLIFAGAKRDREKEAKLRKKGARVIASGKGKADLKQLGRLLPSLGIYSVLVEGGAETAGSFIREKLADSLVLAVSPKKIAGKNAVASPITPAVIGKLKKKRKYLLGKDTVIEGSFKS